MIPPKVPGRAVHLLAVALMVCLGAAGCAPKVNPTKPLSASSSIAIDEQLSAPGEQHRSLPWDSLTMDKAVRFKWGNDGGGNPEQLSAGMIAGTARLKAREEALADLAFRIARLPAAEAPPGETESRSVADMGLEFERIDSAVRESLASRWKEEMRVIGEREAVLTVSLELRPIAEAVLLYGGGFSPEHPVTQNLSAVARAQRDALQKARESLIEKLLEEKLDEKRSIADWAARSPLNRERLEIAVQSARVLRSESRKSADGGQHWILELEFDPTELKTLILKEEKDIERLTGGPRVKAR